MALEVPNFASESDEADWWYDHRDEVSEELSEAVKNGTDMNLHEFLRREGLMVERSEVKLLVEDQDLELAKAQAAGSGVACEEYLASLVHQALHAKQAA